MKLYHKSKRLSSDTKEIIAGAALGTVTVIDLSAFPCFLALVCGAELTPFKFLLSAIFAAQIAAVFVTAAVFAWRAFRRTRRSRGVTVISSQDICRIMEARR